MLSQDTGTGLQSGLDKIQEVGKLRNPNLSREIFFQGRTDALLVRQIQ